MSGMRENEKAGLPFSNRQLQERVNGYFEECGREGIAPTPSGLALRLGVRTFELDEEQLFGEQRRIIGQAMQRIEANMMDILLAKGSVKGAESVLEQIGEKKGAGAQLRKMTDEEIRQRLRRMMPGIQSAIGETEER